MTQLKSLLTMLDSINAPYKVIRDYDCGEVKYDTTVEVQNSHHAGYQGFMSTWYFLKGKLVMVAHWE